jgi:hypothetical protein
MTAPLWLWLIAAGSAGWAARQAYTGWLARSLRRRHATTKPPAPESPPRQSPPPAPGPSHEDTLRAHTRLPGGDSVPDLSGKVRQYQTLYVCGCVTTCAPSGVILATTRCAHHADLVTWEKELRAP